MSMLNIDYPRYFNECNDRQIKDPQAINVYIYNSYLFGSFNNVWSMGLNNQNKPFLLLDYARLPHIGGVEEHELGHAFGLGHVCSTATEHKDDSNIMASNVVDCVGGKSAGARNVGFNLKQLQIIKSHGQRIEKNLAAE